MTLSCRTFWVVTMLLAAVAGGCGKSDGLVRVRGTVTYRDQPLPNALVVFMPETPGLLPASGLTDGGGRYDLMTTVPGDGVAMGKHRVTVTARGLVQAPPEGELSPQLLEGQFFDNGPPLIPEKYFMADTSGLTVDVKSAATLDFALTDQ